MNHPPVFRLRDIEKRHNAAFRLEIAQLDIQPAEVLALVGPTGAGKSTLLRLLAGLEPPTAGEILLEGRPFLAERLPLETRRRIAMVHQRALLLTGTARFNVEYGLRLRRISDRTAPVEAALTRLRLAGLAAQSARTLSGGQTQLVAVARAMVTQPDVLLLDEPTANLDPAHVALVEQAIAGFRPAHGTTIVWATHNLFQARRVADRAALLLNGRLVEVTAAEAFFETPSDPRTLDFVQGRMVY